MGGLWLLSAAGLACLLTLQAGWLRQNILHCVGQSGILRLTPAEAFATYPPANLTLALQSTRWLDLAVFLISLMCLAISTLNMQGRGQYLMALAMPVFAGLLYWHMNRENQDACSLGASVNVALYVWPALLIWMLVGHFAKTLTERASA